jgi:hypothetical protein
VNSSCIDDVRRFNAEARAQSQHKAHKVAVSSNKGLRRKTIKHWQFYAVDDELLAVMRGQLQCLVGT